MPEVSFILVNYHSEAFTRRCIESIRQHTQGVSYEILVVDNHSLENPAAFKSDRPEVRLFLSPVNLGYGAALHFGAAQASGNFLYFLNNDTELLNDTVAIQARFLAEHPEAGLVGVQHIDSKGERALSFDYFPTLLSKFLGTGLLRLVAPRRFPSRRAVYTQPLEVDLVSGASLFMPRALYKSLGGFDPQFFLYCEEEDLALRVRQAGRKVYFLPEARLLHHGGASSRHTTGGQAHDETVMKKEFYISYFAFYRKHYGTAKAFLLRTLTFLQFLWRYLFAGERQVWGALISWYLRGHPDAESLRFQSGDIDPRLIKEVRNSDPIKT
jgi:hypothetical protein